MAEPRGVRIAVETKHDLSELFTICGKYWRVTGNNIFQVDVSYFTLRSVVSHYLSRRKPVIKTFAYIHELTNYF